MKAVSKIIRVLSVLLTIIVGLMLAETYIPKLFGINQYVVLSGSMEPEIPVGSVVFVDTKNKEIREGDVFTYKVETGDKELEITHRAKEVTDTYIIPKGDANENSDGKIRRDFIVGKVVFSIPKLGVFISGITWEKKGILVVFVIILYVLEDLFSKKTKERK